jgi:hypothetical protein
MIDAGLINLIEKPRGMMNILELQQNARSFSSVLAERLPENQILLQCG